MKRIVIIGSSGAGKSSLARELGSINKIKVYHLDRILRQRDWKEKPKETRIDIIQNLVREKQWIIDGTYLSTSDLHLEVADTIIVMDMPALLCLLRIIRRHRPLLHLWCAMRGHPEYHRCPRRDIPMGSTDKLTLVQIWKVLTFPFRVLRTLHQKLSNYNSKQIFRLHSTKEVEDFVAELELHAYEKKQFSKKPSDVRKRHLARVK